MNNSKYVSLKPSIHIHDMHVLLYKCCQSTRILILMLHSYILGLVKIIYETPNIDVTFLYTGSCKNNLRES